MNSTIKTGLPKDIASRSNPKSPRDGRFTTSGPDLPICRNLMQIIPLLTQAEARWLQTVAHFMPVFTYGKFLIDLRGDR